MTKYLLDSNILAYLEDKGSPFHLPVITRLTKLSDEDKFIECGVQGEADFIFSGDKHLKNLKSYQGIRIVDPTAFLAMFE